MEGVGQNVRQGALNDAESKVSSPKSDSLPSSTDHKKVEKNKDVQITPLDLSFATKVPNEADQKQQKELLQNLHELKNKLDI